MKAGWLHFQLIHFLLVSCIYVVFPFLFLATFLFDGMTALSLNQLILATSEAGLCQDFPKLCVYKRASSCSLVIAVKRHALNVLGIRLYYGTYPKLPKASM
jgi:hypothetical protein